MAKFFSWQSILLDLQWFRLGALKAFAFGFASAKHLRMGDSIVKINWQCCSHRRTACNPTDRAFPTPAARTFTPSV